MPHHVARVSSSDDVPVHPPGKDARTIVKYVDRVVLASSCVRNACMQVDKEMYAAELLFGASKSDDSRPFYDMSKPGWWGHWRIQRDLEVIKAAANAQ
jgi:hypothetical protein